MDVECSVDIPADAEPKGNHCLSAAEEVPKRLRLYLASVPWTWVVELYATTTNLLFPGIPPDHIY